MSSKRLLLFFMFALICVLQGCGYHMGSIMHPQVKTIAVAPVVNDTLAYHVAADMRGLLCEQFMLDGSLKVKSPETADCVVYAKVTNVTFAEVTEVTYDDEENYRAKEWKVTLRAEFSVIIPGRNEPLIPRQVVSGSANFQGQADIETSRARGIRQACRDAAQKIVYATTEGW